MKTFVIEYTKPFDTQHLIVIKAENIEEATKIFNKKFKFFENSLMLEKIRELEDNELVYLVRCGY